MNGKITVNSSGTKINSKTNIAGDTVIGDLNASVNSTDGVANKLTVKGNADVTGIFTAGEIRTPKFKSLTLDAGAAAYTGPWNLHVEATKASFAQPDFNVATDKLKITSAESSMKNATITLNANDVAKAVLNSSGAEISSTNNVKMHGNNSVHLYTGTMSPSLTANEVSIQDTMFRANRGTIAINSIVNSFTVKNTDGSKLDQTDISGAVSRVRNMNFQVEEPGGAYVLKVEPQNANKSKVKVDGELIVYNDNAVGDSGEKLLQVSQASNNSGGNATAEITRGKVIVKDNGTTVKKVLTVDANETDKSTADRGSVYIRKGIVELESSYGTKLTDAQVQAQATSGNDKGYVRADRFVSNRGWTNPITGGVVSSFNRGTTYVAYQANPAYTSVMHDIKLTSRGGVIFCRTASTKAFMGLTIPIWKLSAAGRIRRGVRARPAATAVRPFLPHMWPITIPIGRLHGWGLFRRRCVRRDTPRLLRLRRPVLPWLRPVFRAPDKPAKSRIS